MKFLVLGATGMAGHTICLYLKEQGHDVTAFSATPFPYCKNIVGDACDSAAFSALLKNHRFDIVINCIGLLNQTAENNPALAVYLNSYLPHRIADCLKDTPRKADPYEHGLCFFG
jgi:dTDP-4-dehydrorhamnose reductase